MKKIIAIITTVFLAAGVFRAAINQRQQHQHRLNRSTTGRKRFLQQRDFPLKPISLQILSLNPFSVSTR